MKHANLLAAAVVAMAGTVAGPAAWAQATMPTPAVMTDTAPLPAQERQSLGAIVMEDSMVIAQRQAFPGAAQRTSFAIAERQRMNRDQLRRDAELAEARAAEATKVLGGSAAQDAK